MEIFRDKPKKYSNKQDFVFQAVEWIGEDVISDEFDNDDLDETDDLEDSLKDDLATDDLVDEFRDFIDSINPEDFQP
jgi:hypothetical protein